MEAGRGGNEERRVLIFSSGPFTFLDFYLFVLISFVSGVELCGAQSPQMARRFVTAGRSVLFGMTSGIESETFRVLNNSRITPGGSSERTWPRLFTF